MNKESFLYQINFNRKKYPEICQALEDAKSDLGVAWYLRYLISKDIEEKKRRKEKFNIKPSEKENVNIEQKIEVKTTKNDLPEDNGGFL